MKTMAEFKRDAASGRMSLEMIERYGKSVDDIPERLKGVRKVVKTNTVCAMLLNQLGELSELRFGCANLLVYDGDTLTVYDAGIRDLTQQEKEIMHHVQEIRKEYENTYSGGFYKAKDYIKNSACPWLGSVKPIKGKMLVNDKVRDNSIKGNVVLRYKVYIED